MSTYNLAKVERRLGDFVLKVDGWQLEHGSICSIVGDNGEGKTTFLELLAFMGAPQQGTVSFMKQAVAFSDNRQLLALRRRVGYVMQNPYLFNMSVYDNICYGLKVRGVSGSEMRAWVMDIMEPLSLTSLADRNVRMLSGGEAQRVALARVFVLKADAYLLDEPTANVDHRHVEEVERLIRKMAEETQAAVVVTTHSREQADRLSDSVLSVVDGKLLAPSSGSDRAVYAIGKRKR